MNSNEENPLRRKLEEELQGSEWLQKFKALSFGLSKLKAEIPITQLCQLEWMAESETLAIRCPNPEVCQGLLAQTEKMARLNIMAKRFIIKCSDRQDIVVEALGLR